MMPSHHAYLYANVRLPSVQLESKPCASSAIVAIHSGRLRLHTKKAFYCLFFGGGG